MTCAELFCKGVTVLYFAFCWKAMSRRPRPRALKMARNHPPVTRTERKPWED